MLLFCWLARAQTSPQRFENALSELHSAELWRSSRGTRGLIGDSSHARAGVCQLKRIPEIVDRLIPYFMRELAELPEWWIGKDGSDIVMPKRRVEGIWTPSGKQVEEMIFNFMHNKKYVGNQVAQYFGSTNPRDVMQKWNWDIKVYAGTDPVVKPLGLAPRNTLSWKRYHDYVASEGVPTFHADYDEKIPTRPSREKIYTAAACRGICDLVHSTQ